MDQSILWLEEGRNDRKREESRRMVGRGKVQEKKTLLGRERAEERLPALDRGR